MLAIVLVILLPSVSYAEVSDKIASIQDYWVTSLVLFAMILGGSVLRWWLGLCFLLLSILLIAGALDVVQDPHVGPAAIREQGSAYLWAAYGSSALLLVAHVAGLWVGRLNRDAPPSHVSKAPSGMSLWRWAAAASAVVLAAYSIAPLVAGSDGALAKLVSGWREILTAIAPAAYAAAPERVQAAVSRYVTLSWPGYGSYSGPPDARTQIQPLPFIVLLLALLPGYFGVALAALGVLSASLVVIGLALGYLGAAAVLLRVGVRSIDQRAPGGAS